MENLILKHRMFVKGQIEKSFSNELNSQEEEVEKAHQDGDIHPNGKWVWVSSANGGKGDWRTRGGRAHNAHNDKEKKFKETMRNAKDSILQDIVSGKIQAGDHERKWAQDVINERKESSQSNAAAKKIIDLIKISSNKYSDIKKVVAFKTDKGNWAIDYDGANTGLILNGSRLSEAELKQAGVKIEGANANSKKDSDLINDIKSNEDAFIEACGLSDIKRVVSIRETSTSVFIKYENESGQEQEFPLTKNVANSVLKEVKSGKSKKADLKQDKAAQAAGFKDYEEMKGWQDYTTAKNLLKKPSMKTKSNAADRKALEKQVADYEKDHADVIKRMSKKGESSKSSVKIDEDTIDQTEYDRQFKMAKQVDDDARSFAKIIVQTNVDKTKQKLQETIEKRPGAKATIASLQKELTKFISQKKAFDDVEKEISGKKTSTSKKSNSAVNSKSLEDSIISAIKADQGGIDNSAGTKKKIAKIAAAAEKFISNNPNVKLTSEDIDDMIMGDVDSVEEKYGKLKGFKALNDAIESFYDD